MDKGGILYSMFNPLEVEVAEKLIDVIDFAEMVKRLKMKVMKVHQQLKDTLPEEI